MTERQKQYIALGRHKARTDLLWLSENILGMKKIVRHVHGPMADFLQKFDDYQGEDVFNEVAGCYEYTPLAPDPVRVITKGTKRRLLLAPRGWYKTSLNVIAHCIQWILNFPDVTILLVHASQEIVEQVLASIKWHFWKNNIMRYYFPEFCAPIGIKEVGTQTQFNSPARKNWTVSPTLSVGAWDSPARFRAGETFRAAEGLGDSKDRTVARSGAEEGVLDVSAVPGVAGCSTG
jgi:hypothetical protein